MAGGIGVEVAGALERFRWNQAEFASLLAGPVMADLSRRAIRVETLAKQFATGTGGGPQVRTGRLRASITWRPGLDTEGPYVDVGTAVFYAPFVELGTSRAPAYPFLRPALEAARTT